LIRTIMGGNEDCASVLEEFMHDVSNLPAEISHMMEEIQAKDAEMQKSLSVVNSRDAGLQKHVKLSGSLLAHPKEAEYADIIRKHYAIASELQTQKMALSEKACHLLERQIKSLDVKIRDLQNDGQLLEGLPSVFNRKPLPEAQKPFADLPLQGNSALQVVTNNALNMNAAAHRMNSHISPQLAQAVSRQLSQVATNVSAVRSSAPATPSSNLSQQQRHRESSVGTSDLKRRKLNNTSFSTNIPAQPSSLRQSSLGPGATASNTPKPSTPTGTSAPGARSGSLPRTTSSQQAASSAAKKSSLAKHVAPHQQVSKLKGKALAKHARLSNSSASRKKGGSPSVRSRAGGDDDNDSVLSSADPSDTDSHHTQSKQRGRRSKKDKAAHASAVVSDHEDVEDEDEQEDDRRYCFCNERSYGEMVACENVKCQYEWFHLACIGLKKAPDDQEVWYCPACRKDFVKDEKKGK